VKRTRRFSSKDLRFSLISATSRKPINSGRRTASSTVHIEPGRDGLFTLVKSLPAESRWEHGIIMAEDDYAMVHSRYSNPDGSAIVVVDIVRIKDGIFQEHWDVIQPEASEAESKSKLPMFGDKFRR